LLKSLVTISILCFVFSLSGCDKTSHKTDSMLRLEKAHSQVQAIVDKANALLGPNIRSTPLQNLDTLVYASEVTKDARQVYIKLHIVGLEHPELSALEKDMADFQPLLARQAITLMETLVDRTLILRSKIEEVKNQPYGSRNNSIEKMIDYLSKEYNREIDECCLLDLGRINTLLAENRSTYRSFIEIINNIRRELESIIKEEQAASRLRSRLDKLKASIPYINQPPKNQT
jgi:hypothetical protein